MKEKKKEEKSSKQESLRQKLQECEKTRDEYLAGWQRARADFLNYKKEEAERIKQSLEYARKEFILRILPVLDSFDLAEKEIPKDLRNNAVEGLLKIKKQFQEFLKSQGVEEIKTKGRRFDPHFHEAVEQVEAKGEESGLIIEEVKKGYILKGEVIRPAKVKVSK